MKSSISGAKGRSIQYQICGDIGLDVTSEYKYLGLWFKKLLDLQGTGGMLFDCYKQLFDSMVKPVLLYGAGIWGTENRRVINTV